MFPAPPMPVFPAGQSTVAAGQLRFEDITQDGRLIPIAIPPSLAYLWRDVLSQHPAQRASIAQGVIPILTRFTITSLDQPIRVDRATEIRAGFELAHDPASERIFLNVWSEVYGAAGRLSPNAAAGELAIAGKLFAEHTFTRPLAPPDQRRVTRLQVDGYPSVPETVYTSPPPAAAQELPPGAAWTDELADDSAEYVFALDQTDSNQHVNSLVYIRIFMDAINRKLAAASKLGKLRTRAFDVAYRKPSFAGDRARVQLRLFELAGMPGAAGVVVGSDAKPRAYLRAILGQ